MTAINCTLVQVNNDSSTLFKMRVFGIVTPDEDVVTYRGCDYYCIAHTQSFNETVLADIDSSEDISEIIKNNIKTQYMKICSFAFLFGIGKDCVMDKYNRLIPIDLSHQDHNNILINNGKYPPHLVTQITDDIYECLNKLEGYESITSNQKWDLIDKYQDKLDHDDMILEEPEFGKCCCCGGPCNPYSQTCGACPRNGRLMAWGLGIEQEEQEIDQEPENDTDSETGPDTTTCINTHQYNNEDVCILKDVIKRYRDQFKGCLDPKKAITKKHIPHYVVSRHKKEWIPCDIVERKARILVPISWIKSNIIGFF